MIEIVTERYKNGMPKKIEKYEREDIKTSEVEYDEQGKETYRLGYHRCGKKAYEAWYTYNADGKKIRKIERMTSGKSTDSAYEYNEAGRIARKIEINYNSDGKIQKKNEYVYNHILFSDGKGESYVAHSYESTYYADKIQKNESWFDSDCNILKSIDCICDLSGKKISKTEYDYDTETERKSIYIGNREFSEKFLKYLIIGMSAIAAYTALSSVKKCMSHKNKGPTPVLIENQNQR